MGIDDEIFFVLRDDRRERMESKGETRHCSKGETVPVPVTFLDEIFCFCLNLDGWVFRTIRSPLPRPPAVNDLSIYPRPVLLAL